MQIRFGYSRIVGILLVLTSAAQAQDVALVSVRGTVVDSLRMTGLAGAFITIAGTQRTAVSDWRGRFRIDSVPAGTHTFMMQHDVLDSIGFSGRSTRAAVDASHNTVTIAVPSFATLWRGLCGGVPPKDSGIVYGSVRDLVDNPLPGAAVGVVWKDVSYRRSSGLDWKDMGGQIVADSTGRYALCGVPIDVGLNLVATKDSLRSPVVEIAPLTLRLTRRDFRLAPGSGAVAERGTVIGTLTAKGGAPMAFAIVTIEGVPEVRSGEDGRFVMRDVPAGTRQIEVRAVGAAPVTSIVDVASNDTTSVTLEMGRVQTLQAVQVSARTFTTVMVRNIEERKQQGLGYVRDSSAFKNLATVPSAFDGIAGLGVRKKNTFVFWNKRKVESCGMAVWLDRVRVDESVLASQRPEEFAFVEVFLSDNATPPEFFSRGTCGAVVVWTKRFLRL